MATLRHCLQHLTPETQLDSKFHFFNVLLISTFESRKHIQHVLFQTQSLLRSLPALSNTGSAPSQLNCQHRSRFKTLPIKTKSIKTCAFLPCSLCSRNLVHFSRVATFSISSSFFSPILSLSRAASIPTTSRSLLHRPCRRQIARIEPPIKSFPFQHTPSLCVFVFAENATGPPFRPSSESPSSSMSCCDGLQIRQGSIPTSLLPIQAPFHFSNRPKRRPTTSFRSPLPSVRWSFHATACIPFIGRISLFGRSQ